LSKLRILVIGFLFVGLVLSVNWGWRGIDEYDSLAIDYGFPFIWGTQILTRETITTNLGRMTSTHETWRVNTLPLLFDLLFWTGLIAATTKVPIKLPKLKTPKIKVTIEYP